MNWFIQLTMPRQASTVAHETDALWTFISALNLFFFLLIAVLVLYFAVRYRRRKATEVTPHITHNNTLEVVWTVIPLILVGVIFVWGYAGWMKLQVSPGEAMEIQVTGYKWGWRFEYPNGTRSLNELHVIHGKPVRLVMTSEDVLHSFFVPSFRVKHDVVPKRYTEVWFTPTEHGMQQVFCTEYCGKGHSDMLARIFVDTEAQFNKWMEEGSEEEKKMPLKDLGKLVYENAGCATCHSLDGTKGQGPSWKGIWGQEHQFSNAKPVVVDANYVRESIINPQAKVVQGYEGIMPTYQGVLRERQMLGVIEFIKSLK